MDKYFQPINPSPAVGVPINRILYIDPAACSGIRFSSFLSRNESPSLAP